MPTLLRMAVPNMVALSMAVLVALAETFYVGQLGTTSLAAVALVFPFAMLTQMMSNGAMGSGVSSSVSRALGAGDAARAGVLALHAVVVGGVLGVLYALLFVGCGAVFYGWLGGQGAVLAEATRFGRVLFAGAVLVWLCNTLASVIRGTGNMKMPSKVLFSVSLVQVLLGGVLALGLGPVPRMGLVGVALANIVAMALAVGWFLWFLARGQLKLVIPWRGQRLAWPMFKDILRVGAVACLSPVQTALAALLLTGMVARFGPQALAGYGIGQRLEFLLIPMAFGVGMAAVPMVGMAIGAGQVQRARQVAWRASVLAGCFVGTVGAVVTFWPQLWSTVFTNDTQVLHYAQQYLQAAGPAFGFLGVGLVLYFASLGAGHALGPVLAGTLRLLVILGGGLWLLRSPQTSVQGLFAVVGLGMLAYGLATALAVWRTPWGPRGNVAARRP